MLQFIAYIWAVDNVPGVAEAVVYGFTTMVVLFGSLALYCFLRSKFSSKWRRFNG